jgi:pimeloyl-ACP methyl ester carboxylesterase
VQPTYAAEQSSVAPIWFQEAVAAPREHRYITVDGCRISYWRWGPGGRPGVLLVHGGGAHSHWWDHIAPWLVSPDRSLVAIDLSGHGDSGHRESYGLEGWANEMLAVAGDAQFEGPPILVGHSLGGWSTVVAASDHPDRVAGLLLVDCRVLDLESDAPPPDRPPPRPVRVYATLDDAIARYRPEPPQDGNLQFVLDYLAATSARQVEGGWSWKFDPKAIYQRRPGPAALRQVRCPAWIIRGEQGLVTPEIVEATRAALRSPTPVIDVPLAGHHLMLDQPLLLATALRAALAQWEATVAASRS